MQSFLTESPKRASFYGRVPKLTASAENL